MTTRFLLSALGTLSVLAVASFGPGSAVQAADKANKDARTYELRVYTPNAGKQADVNALISKSGTKYMAKHHIELVGAWVPMDKADERVFTLVAHKDKASGAKNWEAFQADEGWKADLAEASKNGRAVASIARFFLEGTDYSPAVAPANVGDRIFELRTYISTPNNLVHLNARFREHTVKLFEKHGMTNIAYFNLLDGEKTTVGELLKGCSAKGKDDCGVAADTVAKPIGLVYFLSHKSTDAAKASFGKFVADAEWKSALAESEKKGGGSLTAKNAVKSLYLTATDYSPIR
ncbi:MAG: NIPSNAP family protein [Gemmataceae bacterium]